MTHCATQSCTRPRTHARAGRPAVDIHEIEGEFLLRADVPGAGKEDVAIELEKGVLTLRATIPSRSEESPEYHLRELGGGEMVRRFRIGDSIDVDGVRAEVERGVLTVHLPKAAAAQPRRIEIT